jgi:hypothetical protein
LQTSKASQKTAEQNSINVLQASSSIEPHPLLALYAVSCGTSKPALPLSCGQACSMRSCECRSAFRIVCGVIRAHGVVSAQCVVEQSLSLAHCQPVFWPDCSIFGRSVAGRRISRPLHANLRAIQSDGFTRLHRRPLCAQRSFDAVSGMAVPSAAIEELTRVISRSVVWGF